ncbi:MAG: hypothetical protein MI757_01635 [Pirellulales bacterium]|nr:hypothetical protein [Pirellulales bacterium]
MKTLLTTAAMALGIALSCTTTRAACEDCDDQPLAVQHEPEEYRSTLFDRSYFTHKPHSDERVAQYMPEQPAYRTEGYYERSAFRYTQSTIGRGRNADRLNVVETWGRGAEIRPYGEWERPFRRGAQPIWMTDPQAYFYGSYPYPYLSEIRDNVNFTNRTPRDGGRDFKDRGGFSKHGGHGSHGKGGGY